MAEKLQRKIADRDAFADIKIDYSRNKTSFDTLVKNTIVVFIHVTLEFPEFRLIGGVNTEWEANSAAKFHFIHT